MPVDLSIEVGHLYLPRMTPPVLEAAAFQAAYWLLPWLRTFTGTYSISVLLDDYTHPRRSDPKGLAVKDHPTVSEAQIAVVTAFAAQGIRLDHVLLEGACAQSAGYLKALIGKYGNHSAARRDRRGAG